VRDVCSDGRRFHKVLLVALTVDGMGVEQTRGAVRDCFQRMRVGHGGVRYFWWAEFQRRGTIHYHGMVIDPPFRFEREARAWFDRHWPHAALQTWVDTKSAAWFRSSAGSYALKDVRKVAGKHYEQDYERMPDKWKTYSSHRLAFTSEEHRPHENRSYVAIRPEQDDVVLVAQDIHVPAADGCLVQRDDRLRRRRRLLRGRAAARGRRGDRRARAHASLTSSTRSTLSPGLRE
jgi:hypothetical protein